MSGKRIIAQPLLDELRRGTVPATKVAIVIDDVRHVHMVGDGNYASACGLDGDDPNTGQRTEDTNVEHEPITCRACWMLWRLCARHKKRDFRHAETAKKRR